MPDILLISKQCFLDFAKQGKEFDKKNMLEDFLCPWPDFHEFVNEIFNYLQRSNPQSQNPLIRLK